MRKISWDSWFKQQTKQHRHLIKYTTTTTTTNSSRGANLESTLLPPQCTRSLWAYENTVAPVFLTAIEENCFKYFLVSSACASVLLVTYLYLYLCWIQTKKRLMSWQLQNASPMVILEYLTWDVLNPVLKT